MAFTDFPNGLSGVDDYLSQSSSINAQLSGSVADIARLTVSAELDADLKEIICSLMAGRGLKLPNIQICASLNLKQALGIPLLQSELYDALNDLSGAFDSFLDHTKIEEVLGRVNNVIAEITQVANMINFCSSPIDPVAIPNLLENAMGSFLGKGKGLIDRIGTFVPDQIGGCLIDGELNCGAFEGGILGSICDNYAAVSAGTADQAFIDSIAAECASIVSAINDLIDKESVVSGSYDQGGSDLAEDPRELNENLGVLHNAANAGVQGNTRVASQLKALYDNLGSYQVVADDGTVYNNIFETFVDPDLLKILRRTTDPIPEILDRQPVYNYCGEVVGYTAAVIQSDQTVSEGIVPGSIDHPGFNAGGLVTDPVAESLLEEGTATGSGSVVNNITNVTNFDTAPVTFVATESAQLLLSTNIGDLVYRTDEAIMYVDNGGIAGTMADFNIVGGGIGIDWEDEGIAVVSADTVNFVGTNVTVTNVAGVATVTIDSGVGDVSKVGTPLDNEVGVWTGDGTIEGTTGLTYSGLALGVTGDIVVSGTVDGRDLATDGSKLDGIESGATADQTGAEIKSLYEAELDTNAFTDAEQTKLSGIATGATVGIITQEEGVDVLTAPTTMNFVGTGVTVTNVGGVATVTVSSGAGNVTKVGTPVNNEIGVWTGDGTLEGDTNFTWDGTSLAITGNMVIDGEVTQDSATSNLATVTQTQVTSFVAATYSSAKFMVQVHDTVSGERQVSEILVIHDGTTASATEYGIIYTGAASLASFNVDINAGNVRLLATSASTNSTNYTIYEILLT